MARQEQPGFRRYIRYMRRIDPNAISPGCTSRCQAAKADRGNIEQLHCRAEGEEMKKQIWLTDIERDLVMHALAYLNEQIIDREKVGCSPVLSKTSSFCKKRIAEVREKFKDVP